MDGKNGGGVTSKNGICFGRKGEGEKELGADTGEDCGSSVRAHMGGAPTGKT